MIRGSRPAQLGAVLLLLVGGVLLGATGAVVQAGQSRVGSVPVPWGMLAVLVTLVVGVRGACWWRGSRTAGAALLVGWVLASLVMAGSGPGGDVLLPNEARSWVYLLGGAVLGVAALVLPFPDGAVDGAPRAPEAPGDPVPPAATDGAASGR